MLLFIPLNQNNHLVHKNFNTSHVTVYRGCERNSDRENRFQYISCYCLSYPQSYNLFCLHISIHLMLLFINILMRTHADRRISIHLMLLFIITGIRTTKRVNKFQYISCYCLSFSPARAFVRTSYFNTSHVTVYQCTLHTIPRIEAISIHLMLLFITIEFAFVKFII